MNTDDLMKDIKNSNYTKGIDKNEKVWNTNDYIKYFSSKYYERYKNKMLVSVAQRGAMKNILNRLKDKEKIIQYIDRYFKLKLKEYSIFNFSSSFIQTKLDSLLINSNKKREVREELPIEERLKRIRAGFKFD